MNKLRPTRLFRPTRLIAISLIVCVLLMFAQPEIASACPTCKNGLHNDGTAFAYACSILFMMGMPFVILTFWVVTIVRLRAKAAKVAAVSTS